MKKSARVLFNLSALFCFIYGSLYFFSLVFIPVAIYCFLAGKCFTFRSEHQGESLISTNKDLKMYVILACIFIFPFGFLSLIAYNVVKDMKPEEVNVESEQKKEDVKIETVETNEKPKTEIKESEKEMQEETEEEKIEKFNKLKKFNAKGIITDDELEQAREQLFGRKEK